MTGELIYIPLRMYTTQVDYQNLENGPDGPGLYKIEVQITKLTTDEILDRLREKLSAPVLEEPSECVLGCVEVGPHGSHKIWVENESEVDHIRSRWKDSAWPVPQYLWEICPGSDG